MRIPRVRFSVRMMIALVALAGVGLFLWEEFREGVPPRSTIRSIPGRVGRLRLGMTEAEAKAVLGMDRPWWLGGLVTKQGLAMRPTRKKVLEHYYVYPAIAVTMQTDNGPWTGKLIAGQFNLVFWEDAHGRRRLSDATFVDRQGKRLRMTDPYDPPQPSTDDRPFPE